MKNKKPSFWLNFIIELLLIVSVGVFTALWLLRDQSLFLFTAVSFFFVFLRVDRDFIERMHDYVRYREVEEE